MLYRVDPDGNMIELMTDIVRPNGIEVGPTVNAFMFRGV